MQLHDQVTREKRPDHRKTAGPDEGEAPGGVPPTLRQDDPKAGEGAKAYLSPVLPCVKRPRSRYAGTPVSTLDVLVPIALMHVSRRNAGFETRGITE